MSEVDRIRKELDAEAAIYGAALEQMRQTTEKHNERIGSVRTRVSVQDTRSDVWMFLCDKKHSNLTDQLRRAMEVRTSTVRKLDEALVPPSARIKLDVGLVRSRTH